MRRREAGFYIALSRPAKEAAFGAHGLSNTAIDGLKVAVVASLHMSLPSISEGMVLHRAGHICLPDLPWSAEAASHIFGRSLYGKI